MAALVLGCSVLGRSASACSLTEEHVSPTNFELVRLSEAIVVATAMEEVGKRPDQKVVFQVEGTLKGDVGADRIELHDHLGTVEPSDPVDISGPHPESAAGGCNRYTVEKGRRYLLFLKRYEDGRWGYPGFAYARINEDYFGPDAVWPSAVRTYLDIQARHDPMAELAALETLLGQKAAARPSPERDAKILDIVHHLRAVSPWKPTPWLVALYERLERGQDPGLVDLPQPVSSSGGAVVTRVAPTDEPTRAEQMEYVLRALAKGDHPTAAALFDRLATADRLTPGQLGMTIRYLARNSQFRRAYGLIETRAMALLPALPGGEASGLIRDLNYELQGENRDEGEERWRSDPYVAAAWPELALRLYWYQVERFGPDRASGFKAIEKLRPVAPRARPEVTLALAALFDEATDRWAVAELTDEAKRKAYEAVMDDDLPDPEKDPAALPMRVLVYGHATGRDDLLKRTFCQSQARRFLTIGMIGAWGTEMDEDLIAAMAVSPSLGDDDRHILGAAAAEIYGREKAAAQRYRNEEELGGWNETTYELLLKVVRREKPDEAKPIDCPGYAPG